MSQRRPLDFLGIPGFVLQDLQGFGKPLVDGFLEVRELHDGLLTRNRELLPRRVHQQQG